MKGRIDLKAWLWGVVPVGLIFVTRLYFHWQSGFLKRVWVSDVLLVIGWVLGWMLAEADHLFYATMCNPQELTCQRVRKEIEKRDWKKAWGILEETKRERTRLPIRNILTAFVMTGVGLWVISSSGSLLAAGMCLGFAVKLFSEIITDRNYQNWYWLFARQFTNEEHKGLMIAWGFVLIWQWLILARG